MKTFENIIGLMSPQPSPSVSLKQHCSAMRMDDRFAFTFNRLVYAITDAKKG